METGTIIAVAGLLVTLVTLLIAGSRWTGKIDGRLSAIDGHLRRMNGRLASAEERARDHSRLISTHGERIAGVEARGD